MSFGFTKEEWKELIKSKRWKKELKHRMWKPNHKWLEEDHSLQISLFKKDKNKGK